MGFKEGDLILEVGRANGCDENLRQQIRAITGSEFLDGQSQEVVDGVIIWWRDGDGDLVDELMDALTYLSETGPIWVLTPKVGRDGHVEPSDIQDAAPTAGLSQTSSFSIAPDWSATRLVARKAGKRQVFAMTQTTLTIGQAAPDFEVLNQHGEKISLSSFKGEKNVVLLFYPFAFSGICTGELCALRDDLAAFQNENVQLLAISCDPMYAQRAFAEQEGYKFPVLADFWPHGEVAKAYGVFEETRGCATRGTFVIDKEGILRWQVVNGLGDARNIVEYKAAIAAL